MAKREWVPTRLLYAQRAGAKTEKINHEEIFNQHIVHLLNNVVTGTG
jgi:hypothetical protein